MRFTTLTSLAGRSYCLTPSAPTRRGRPLTASRRSASHVALRKCQPNEDTKPEISRRPPKPCPPGTSAQSGAPVIDHDPLLYEQTPLPDSHASQVRSTLVRDIVVALRARPARVDGITYERGREPRE